MPFVKIWIHAVWSTKDRQKILTKDIRPKLFQHMKSNGLKKEIMIDRINGHLDHVHCLFRLRNDQNISKVLQLIKGESAFWFNRSNLSSHKLVWQSEYFAVSVSESQVDAVRKYIENQETHHKSKTFDEEYQEFVDRFRFLIDPND